ncbi:glycosyltransferase family 2 protein [Chloroflexota bacterium]
MNPIVSVIIPTYNRAHLVGRSILSVLGQTYQGFELIVVDDSSTDDTEDVVHAFNDPRIRFIQHRQNRGANAARNTGLRAARGEYIAFQDSDDEWLPRKLERQMAMFEEDRQGTLGLVLCDRIVVSERGELRLTPRMHRLNYEELLLHPAAYGVGTVVFLVKKSLTAPELHFDEDLPALQDWDLLLRLSRLCRIGCVSEPLIRTYRHDGPQIHTPQNVLKAHFILRRKYATQMAAKPKAVSFSHWQIALNYYQLRQMGDVQGHLKAAIKAYPWQPMSYLNLAASVFGYRGFWLFIKLRRVFGLLAKSKIPLVAFTIGRRKEGKVKGQSS